jgi:hypothetical protein
LDLGGQHFSKLVGREFSERHFPDRACGVDNSAQRGQHLADSADDTLNPFVLADVILPNLDSTAEIFS